MSNMLYDPKVFEKLQKVRTREDISLKPCARLRETLEDGTKLTLRNYQKQMVINLLYQKRFVIGEDPGLGKCVTGDTLIQTDEGLVPIQDMHDWSHMKPDSFEKITHPWRVAVGSETLPVKNFYYGGVKATIRVKTRYGFEVEGSRIHPLLVKRPEGLVWVKLEDLRKGDYLCVARQESTFPLYDPLREELEVNGVRQVTAVAKTVPPYVLKGSRQSNIEFLKDLFERDGSVTLNGLEWSSASETFVRQVQIMLTRFGVIAKKSSEKGYGREPLSWRLTIEGQDAVIFQEQIGFLSQCKKEQLKEALTLSSSSLTSHYFYDPVVSLEENETEVYDIEVDDARHWFVGNGLMNHNTLECIAALCYMWEKEPDIVPVIITTTSALHQFAGEIRRFTHGVEAIVVEGSPQKRLKTYESFFKNWSPDKPTVLLTNYPRLRNDRTELLEAIPEGCKLCVFADEIQAVKNPDSATHHAVKNLSAKCERFYGMTATLIKNNLTEGFGIYKVVLPHLFPSIKYFHRYFCIMDMQQLPGRKGRKIPIVVGHSKEHIKNFRSTIEPFYLGRAKAEVATELPTLTIKTIDVRSTSAQWQEYVSALQGLLEVNKIAGQGEGLEGGDEKEVTKLTQLIYTQQIVNSPYLIGNEGPSGKENYFLELLEEELEDQKVIVFTRFRGMVDRLGEILEEKRGYTNAIKQEGRAWVPDMKAQRGYVRVTGDEDGEQREAGRRAFTESDGTNLIFITMAGIEAINLQKANVMVFYDLPWSAGDYIQCLDQETEILTAEGWRGRGQIHKGDRVAAFNQDTSEVSWLPALEVYDRPLGAEEEMFEFHSRHLNFRVTGEHRMLYKRPGRKGTKSIWPSEWQIQTAESLEKERSHFRVPACGTQRSAGVPLTPSELEFIGWYMSDGCINKANHQLVISQAHHQPQIKDLQACLDACGFNYSIYQRDPSLYKGGYPNGQLQSVFSVPKGTQGGSRARKGWGYLEPYLDKALSPSLEDITPEQLSHLLKGLHLGDGAKCRNVSWERKTFHIYTALKDLADNLQSLCVRKGFRCNITFVPKSEDRRKEGYMLHIKPCAYWALSGAVCDEPRPRIRKSETVKGERVWCVENELQTLITRRRGKVIIMGNCVGRMIRIGSEHEKVYALHLLAEGPDGQKTIDHHVQKTLDKKMNLVEAILGSRLNKAEDEEVDFIKEKGRSDLDDIYSAMTQSAKDLKG